MNGQLHTPAILPPGKETALPIAEKFEWASKPVNVK